MEECLCFEYHYGNLLPEGLLPRFIVRAYTRIEDQLLWRTGVVLAWKGARALVKADEHDRVIIIRVRGKPDLTNHKSGELFPPQSASARELLGLIREHFDTIHRNFRQLCPVEKIRVPSASEALIDYAKVEVFAHTRQGKLDEYVKGHMYHLDARQILALFDVPGAKQNPRLRGAASSPELPLGLSVIEKRAVQ